jgi:hypothetical protein
VRSVTRFAISVVVGTTVLAACSTSSDEGSNAAVGGRVLATRTVSAGAVRVTISPKRVDHTRAEFGLEFDTHSGSLDFDPATSTTLTVDGKRWLNATWMGDGPGGHHRAGTLRFDAAGTPQGQMRLVVDGLDPPVVAVWSLGP